jgi:ribonucleoside-triphosphate reductase
MNERISTPEACRNLVRKILTNYRLPYITITPTFSICPKHGYLSGEHDFCPKCDSELGIGGERFDEVYRKTYVSTAAEK